MMMSVKVEVPNKSLKFGASITQSQKYLTRGKSLQNLINQGEIQKQIHNLQYQQMQTKVIPQQEMHIVTKLKQLQQHPGIQLQPIYQPQFQTKLLGSSSISIREYQELPRDAMSTIKINQLKGKIYKRDMSNKPSSMRVGSSPDFVQLGSANKDITIQNQKTLKKYQDITVKLLSDKQYIMSEEYLNDDSYLDFKYTNQINGLSLQSPRKLNIANKGKQSQSKDLQKLVPLNQKGSQIFKLEEQDDNQINYNNSSVYLKHGLNTHYNLKGRKALNLNVVDLQNGESNVEIESITEDQNQEMRPTYDLPQEYLQAKSIINSKSSSRLPVIKIKGENKTQSKFLEKSEFLGVESQQKKLFPHDYHKQSPKYQKVSSQPMFQAAKTVEGNNNFNNLNYDLNLEGTLQNQPIIPTVKFKRDSFIEESQQKQNDQDMNLLQQQLQHQSVLLGLQELSQKKEKRRQIMNIKNYNKFRQKIANEDRKFHLLAHNLCDNLKRTHIRLDVDDYKNLKTKIKEAIAIKYDKKSSTQLMHH
ncbi:UNKNOWN [Stylonychia lemnae]|uniref:Uncharacterized protein n=1 Tax=Stylonychia lemnae TaxID=5949 RepID=A0A078AWX8_STYLE|nr:UNKNOWN [Stylonychia lemnae]|eukprot:CDW85308.1 UNKNOWN [Stylonychia lemnae]